MASHDTTNPMPGTTTRDALIEAHTRWELEHLTGEGLRATIEAEVRAAFDWLGTCVVADVAPAAEVGGAVSRLVDGLPLTDELVGLVADVFLAARAVLVGSRTTPGDVFRLEDLEDVVRVCAGSDQVRSDLVGALTGSSAYHQLVAHVLYQGIKAYVLTENVFARTIPGAASMVRLGQRGVNTAVPGLEKAIDRQLRTFIQANIGDTLSDSRRYLEHMLSGDSILEVFDEAWQSVADLPLGRVVQAVDDSDIEAVTVTVEPLVRHALRSGRIGPPVGQIAERVLTEYADLEVASTLAAFGVGPDLVVEHLMPFITPAVAHAGQTGRLHERVRARFAAFYESDAFEQAMAAADDGSLASTPDSATEAGT